jgi:HD-GYP domain-containing protein (c-di-GMP phosphodiesterase class II)
LAEAINATLSGPFGAVHFTDRQIRELRYASLLHDFGKVGVREQVLVKSKKLEPSKLEIILQRIHQRQEELAMAKLHKDWEDGVVFDPESWQRFMEALKAETRHTIEVVLRSNEPSVLSQEIADELSHLHELRYTHWNGQEDSVVDTEDLACLNIRRGSLSDEERMEIESHVAHTYNFLKQIPWTRDLAAVPDIAFAHHERVNGTGYPRRVDLKSIPIQSRAMSISDVFDALTAQDRPYKAAVPLERSLRILEEDAKVGNLDPELLQLFIEAKVFERTVKPS